MKLILYISEATQDGITNWMPAGYRDLLNVSRTNNNANDINGMLAYNSGHFLQILEGDDSQVDRLIMKILKDERHRNFSILINETTTNRTFSQWNMRLVSDIHKDHEFTSFIERYRFFFNEITSEERDILEKFIKLPESIAEISSRSLHREKGSVFGFLKRQT